MNGLVYREIEMCVCVEVCVDVCGGIQMRGNKSVSKGVEDKREEEEEKKKRRRLEEVAWQQVGKRKRYVKN